MIFPTVYNSPGAKSDAPGKVAVSGDQHLDYVPIVPENAVRSWKTRHVNVIDVDVPHGPRKPLRACDGWTRHVHPSGRVYMRHEGLRVVMEGNQDVVCTIHGTPTRVAELSRLAAQHLWGLMGDTERSDYELFLRIDLSPSCTASYYFVDWANRSIFWAQQTETPQPIASLWHLDGVRESQFWTHVDHYPMHHPLPSDSGKELAAILAYQTIDAETFKDTTAPWKSGETHLLATSLPGACHRSSLRSQSSQSSLGESDIPATHGPSGTGVTVSEGASNACAARLWRHIWLCRVQNFYGDSYARLGRTERRNEFGQAPEPPKWLRTLLSFLLFNHPPRFYNELRDVYVDGIIYQVHWKAFVADDVHPEWRRNGMMAGVLLVTNMAFQVLGGADNVAHPFLTSKFLSLSSIIFATTTLCTAMRLIAFHGKLTSARASDMMHYMHRCTLKPLGLFGVAMLFSVPFVTFMWSMLAFIAAILVFGFQHWSAGAGIPLITTTIAPVLGLVVWIWWFFATSPLERNIDEEGKIGTRFRRFLQRPRREGTGNSTCQGDENLEKGV